MKKLTLFMLACLCALPLCAQLKKKSLAVDQVTLAPSVKAAATRSALHETCLTRVSEGLDLALMNELASARKYTIVERSDNLEKLLQEINLSEGGLVDKKAMESGKLTGAELLLFSQITNFTLTDSMATFNGSKQRRLACDVTLQARIVNVETGEIHATSNFRSSQYTIVDVRFATANEDAALESLIPEITTDIARQCAQALMAYAYPAKVIDVDGDVITINRGEGTFTVGETVQVMSAGRKIVDPDTGETYEIPGRKGCTARIVYVDMNISQAEIPEGASVKMGARVTK